MRVWVMCLYVLRLYIYPYMHMEDMAMLSEGTIICVQVWVICLYGLDSRVMYRRM